MKRPFLVLSVFALAISIAAQQQSTPPAAQTPSDSQTPKAQPKPLVIPDKFTNLTVLPKDISKPDLMNVMKSMTSTTPTGRCSYCHAVSDDLTEGNLASDEKPVKARARKMLTTIMELKHSPAVMELKH